MNILLINNSNDLLEITKELFEAEFFSVYSAENVSIALDLLSKTKIDYILLDGDSPLTSGIEFIRQTAKMFASPPPVFVASSNSSEQKINYINAGALEYFDKFAVTLPKIVSSIVSRSAHHK